MTPVLELKDLHVTLRQHRRATELVKGVSFAVAIGRTPSRWGQASAWVSWESQAAGSPCP